MRKFNRVQLENASLTKEAPQKYSWNWGLGSWLQVYCRREEKNIQPTIFPAKVTRLTDAQSHLPSIYKKGMINGKIEPLAVCLTNGSLIVIALCQLRKDILSFDLTKTADYRHYWKSLM